jgi:CBS domain containing-hemolysin-like protein
VTPAVAIPLGVAVILLLTGATGYFVALEFAYVAVDRADLGARAAAGDRAARRALAITRRTSFLLSGAQVGITVTGLLVGYAAEPLVGEGLGRLLGGIGVPPAAGVAAGTALALLFATVVQMVLGELFPKNLAIARPTRAARWLAPSTSGYLTVFGWLIRLFDAAANALLRRLRIEPAHDVEHAATARDLAHILAASQASGALPGELSTVLARTLELRERTAEHAMTPRPRLAAIGGAEPVSAALHRMVSGHSRLPVFGGGIDDVIGVLWLRDVLAMGPDQAAATSARAAARPAVLVPASLPLPAVLAELRASGEELACVVDEYGGLAGVITVEDIAEELVGEIADEHDPEGLGRPRAEARGWTLPGITHLDEVQRLIGHELPQGDYETIAGLVIARLRRLPRPGDSVTIELPRPPGEEGEPGPRRLLLTVRSVARHVPRTVSVVLGDPAEHARRERDG